MHVRAKAKSVMLALSIIQQGMVDHSRSTAHHLTARLLGERREGGGSMTIKVIGTLWPAHVRTNACTVRVLVLGAIRIRDGILFVRRSRSLYVQY